jgi:hypothetical protein
MAIFTLTDAMVIVNGVTLSDHANKVTVEDTRDPVDITAFGATSKAVTKGLGDASITVDFFQDFAAGEGPRDPAAADRLDHAGHHRGPPDLGRALGDQPGRRDVRAAVQLQLPRRRIGEATEITAEFKNGAQAGITYPTA